MATNEASGEGTQIDGLLDAFGDRSRRSIVECLREQPHAVTELAQRLPISRPAISQHLKVLGDAGIVSHRSMGTRHVYTLEPAALEALRAYLDVVWRDGLDSYRKLAKEQP